jgi:hypothetical protein
MKRSILFVLLAMFLLRVTASPAPQQPVKARIEGAVVRLGTGEPVRGAKLTLTRGRGGAPANAPVVVAAPRGATPAAPAAPPANPPPVVTDDLGKFSFPDLDEGSYTLQILGNGYVSQNYGQRYTNGPGTPIVLTAGQEMKNLAVTLTPAGNISGRITDRSDQPLANVPVQLMRYSYDAQGQRSYQNVGAAKTNDRGEYRIYWITPGRYYLLAGTPGMGASPLLAMMMMMEGGGTNPNELPITLGYAYFPGVSDLSLANAIELRPGAELESVNFTLTTRPPTYRIRGRVVDSRTGQPPARARVAAVSRNPGMSASSILNEMAMEIPINNYNSASGVFEIRDLLPGNYSVTAVVQDPVPPSAGGRAGPAQPPAMSTGAVALAVSDTDIDGVVITVVPAATISGRIRSDGSQQLPVTPDRIRIILNPRNPSLPGRGASNATPAADGTFRLPSVAIGDYRVALQSQGGAAAAGARPGSNAIYIRDARLDGADVLNGPLRISNSASGTLDIVVGVGGGQVSGVLSDRRSQPVPVAQVVLIPERTRDRIDLYRTVTTDGNGRFNLVGITPGDYKLFSWEGLEPNSWFDPELMLQSENKGHLVRVTDTSSEMIDLKLIQREGTQ